MQVDCLIEAIEAARENWEYVLELVPESAAETVDPATGWSVKDHIAHVAWHELEMIGLMQSMALEGSSWWLLNTDQRNANIHEEYRNVSLEDVLATAELAYATMIEVLTELEDEDLNDPSRFKNMPPDWTPWRLIASNTYQHYLEHAISIRKMLRAAKG